ncbi:hypothetical protein LUZ60_011493 [Juncus effusus]|nr:hypothetical protein LUZ60_011493 [Juncus effusus]
MEEVSVDEESEQGRELKIQCLQELRSTRQILDEKRREALDKLLDIKGSIRVFCRIRPFTAAESWRKSSPISTESEKININSVGSKKEFIVDRVFTETTPQVDVYKEIEPIIKSAFDGHNVCVLAYGQTGTGKTYTMEGVRGNLGIVPRSIEELFNKISQEKSENYTLNLSMLEVYLGNLRDLLAPKQHSSRSFNLTLKSNINIMAKSSGSVEIEGLTDIEISNFKQAIHWYNKGRKARSTSWTNVNETSSRSHCLTRIIIREGTKGKIVSKIWLVDLGGSERLLKTGATGHTLDEGKSINLSLSAFGDVISALKQKRHHVPYRNSKLTQALSDSLGEGSRVVMVVHVSPSQNDLLETVCSLTFARRVRSIESNKELSEETKRIRQKHIAELDQHIQEAEMELQNLKILIEKTETYLQEKNKKYLTEGSPRSPLILDHVEFTEPSQNTDKISRKLGHESTGKKKPNFMAPTVSSKQRRNLTGERVQKLKNSKFVSGKNLNFSGSQIISKITSNSMDRDAKRTSSYNPNWRNPLQQHRRRMTIC